MMHRCLRPPRLDGPFTRLNCDHKIAACQTRAGGSRTEGRSMAMAGSAGARRIAAVRREGQPHPRAPVHDKVYQAIQEGLIGGRFVPGRSVTLRGLAEILGVSPMPVRAAVARLVAEGALAMTPTRRVSVPAMTPGRFDELVRARILLESEAAVRAMPDIDAGRLAALEA